jgi:hypothetical protein
MRVQLEEIKGLILPSEQNRKTQNLKSAFDPRVEICLVDPRGGKLQALAS